MDKLEGINKSEISSLINKFSKNGFEYGKPLKYLCFRNNCKEARFREDLIFLKNFKVGFKQVRNEEERFLLYFIYNKRKGRVYVLKFKDKIRIITVFPLGIRTIKRYSKRRFKNIKG